ncbi:Sulfoacetaldehyde acetyltransferase [Geodia barretti]|uniref:Sulfoacetaldehyde acetyltransferase n=1 Tax=Geodia barretti TaxID=519541 RepID=A0AA35X8L0_GEOBA|nr:Sulfoacetaldehyde acetyltransferase [Geodia barretti]
MTRMTPSEAFVETMVAHGVDTIFGIMGSAFMDAMDIFEPAGIELVPVVHEQGAAHMAVRVSAGCRPHAWSSAITARHLQLLSKPP